VPAHDPAGQLPPTVFDSAYPFAAVTAKLNVEPELTVCGVVGEMDSWPSPLAQTVWGEVVDRPLSHQPLQQPERTQTSGTAIRE